MAVTAGLVVQVDDREAALAQAVALAEARGGWFASLSTDHVDLRVPAAEAPALVEALRGLGELVDRSYDRRDLGPQLTNLDVRLESRRSVLARYEAVLAEASPKSVVTVERQITGLVGEIEQLEGQRRVLVDQVAHARVSLSLRFRERRAPRPDGSSSFAWLNTVNIDDLLRDFEQGWRAPRSRATVPTPEGFAAWRRRGRFQAESPDGVRLRVRKAKNKPTADLTYWSEALQRRMTEAGYTVLSSQTTQTTAGASVYLLELGAGLGETDVTYLVGLMVSGRKLVVIEAAGESTVFRDHRAQVVAAVEGITIP